MRSFIRLLVAVPLCVMSASHEVYVSCSVGSDENPGTAVKPFRTLHAARDALRAARFVAPNWTLADAAEVHVLVDATSSDADAGRCEVAKPLELDERDSNVHWISDGGPLLLSGGVRLDPSSFTSSSTDNVVTVDLRKHGIRDFGKLRGRGYAGGSGCIKTQNYEPSALELFYRDAKKTVSEERQMVLARYPDLTYPVAKDNWMQVASVSSSHIAVPSLAGRMRKWHNETVWAHGLWKWNWADSHRPVLAYNASAGSLEVGDDDVNADVQLSRGGNFYVYNVRAELDHPGEYYVNSETGILEFLPPQIAGQHENATYHVSLSTSILHVMGASDVTFDGFEFRYTRGPGVVVENSTRVTFNKCVFGDIGMMALNVTGGSMCGLHSSIVEGAGDGGVVLNGGDRKLLTPAGHFVSNTSLHHNQRWIMNYAPHVLLAGVGNSIRDSELFNAPQIAVFMQGNDHALLSSYIHDAAQQCSDCGAFYMGRDWTYRGNILDGNTWRRISSVFGGGVCEAVYLDDMLSSVNITNNIFDDVETVFALGGGRHNVFTGNFINSSSNQPVRFDARGLNWDKKGCKAGGLPYEFLAQVPYKSDPWKKYAGLANILNDFPCEPRHNVISNNVMCHGATTLINQKAATISAWHSVAENNTVCKSFTSLTAEELFV